MIASEATKPKIGVIFSRKRDAPDSSCHGWSRNRCTGSSACAWARWAVTIVATEGAESYIVSRSIPPYTNIRNAGIRRTACRSWLGISVNGGIYRGDNDRHSRAAP